MTSRKVNTILIFQFIFVIIIRYISPQTFIQKKIYWIIKLHHAPFKNTFLSWECLSISLFTYIWLVIDEFFYIFFGISSVLKRTWHCTINGILLVCHSILSLALKFWRHWNVTCIFTPSSKSSSHFRTVYFIKLGRYLAAANYLSNIQFVAVLACLYQLSLLQCFVCEFYILNVGPGINNLGKNRCHTLYHDLLAPYAVSYCSFLPQLYPWQYEI